MIYRNRWILIFLIPKLTSIGSTYRCYRLKALENQLDRVSKTALVRNGNRVKEDRNPTSSRHHFAVGFISQIPKALFSVSIQITKYPIPGTAIFGTMILPPSFSTFAAYSSTEGTPM